jgi:hypothetical protein
VVSFILVFDNWDNVNQTRIDLSRVWICEKSKFEIHYQEMCLIFVARISQ